MEKAHSGKTQTKLVPRIWAALLVSDSKLREMPNCYKCSKVLRFINLSVQKFDFL